MKKRSEYKYTAFISYRHVEPDASIAAALHKAIETFKTPKEFYEEGKAPNFRVFRDREELSAKDLSDSIQDALENSYYLIVISSKRTPLSQWCTKEVELFRKLHGDERILSVLIEGEPWESFSQPMKELKKKVVIDGELREEPLELLAAELRPPEVQSKNFPGYAQLEQEESDRLKRLTKESLDLLKNEKYRVMAAILGCSYGDLRQRDKERRNKLYLQISAFFSVLFLIFGLFMLRAYQKENVARREAIQTSSTMLLQRGRELLNEGDKVKSLLVAKEAMGPLDEKMEHYQLLKEQHQSLLSDALYPVSASLRTRIDTNNTYSYIDVSEADGLLAVGLGNDGLGLFDSSSGELLHKLEGHQEQVKIVSFSPDGKYLLSGGFDNVVHLWDMSTKKILRSINLPGVPQLLRFSTDGESFFLGGGDSKSLQLIKQNLSGDEQQIVETTPNVREVNISKDGEKMLVLFYPGLGSYAHLYNFKTAKWEKDYLEPLDKEDRKEIVMLRFAADEESLFMRTKSSLHKIAIESGETLYSIDMRYWQGQERTFREKEDGSVFYYADNTIIREVDSRTGEELRSTHFEEGIIKDMILHHETGILAVYLEGGKLALWKDGGMLDSGIALHGASPNQIQFNEKGDCLYLSSPSSKEVYYVDLESRLSLDAIDGQIVSVSPQGKKVLFLGKENLFLWDTETMKKEKDIAKEVLTYSPKRVLDETKFTLSDDGKWLAIHDYEIGESGNRHFIRVFDLTGGEEQQIPVESGQYLLSFTPDSQKLAVAKQDGDLRFYTLDGKEEELRIPLFNYLTRIHIGKNAEQVSLYYAQGRSYLYSLESGELLKELPGEVLWMEGEEYRGIYNRSGFIAKGDKIDYQDMDPVIDQISISSYDQHLYDERSNRLLVIRNGGEKPVAFLLDFGSGRLIRSFYPSLSTKHYAAKGFFQGEEGDLVLDQSFNTSYAMETDEEIIEVFAKSLQFHLPDYEEMVEEAGHFLGKRNLSPKERKELGLEE